MESFPDEELKQPLDDHGVDGGSMASEVFEEYGGSAEMAADAVPSSWEEPAAVEDCQLETGSIEEEVTEVFSAAEETATSSGYTEEQTILSSSSSRWARDSYPSAQDLRRRPLGSTSSTTDTQGESPRKAGSKIGWINNRKFFVFGAFLLSLLAILYFLLK